jgi:hypothetical protein
MDEQRKPQLEEDEEKRAHHHQHIWLAVGLIETFYHIPQLIILAVLAFDVNKNYLWASLNLFILILDLMISWTHHAALAQFGMDDLAFIEIIPCFQLFSFACYKNAKKGLWLWLIWQNVFWAFLVLLWIRPAFLYTDAFGGTFAGATSLAGRSSCARATFYQIGNDCTQRFPGRDVIAHPLGAFSIDNGFQQSGVYATCPLEQTWAHPTWGMPTDPLKPNLWLGGFVLGSNGIPICSQQVLIGGFVSRYNCPNGDYGSGNDNVCLQGYPGLWYGLKAPPSSPEALLNTTANLPMLCPGNTGALTTRTTKYNFTNTGRPLPICSFCLWYVIYQALRAGIPPPVSDEVLTTCLPGWNRAVSYAPEEWGGWKSYVDGTTDPSVGCALCPGRGVGLWGFSTEVYDNNGVEASYWLYTVLALILPGWRKLAVGIILFWQGALKYPNPCPERRKKWRGDKKHPHVR